jgi:hypothetical protein
MLEAIMAFAEGEHDRALEQLALVATSSAELGFVWQQTSALETLADRLYALDRIEDAEAKSRDALALARRIGDWEDAAYGLAMLAGCSARRGDAIRAGRLWGAVEARHQREPLEVWELISDRFEPRVQEAAGAHFEAGRRAGRGLTLEEVVEEELAEVGARLD